MDAASGTSARGSLLIRDIELIDGTGAPSRRADILVDGPTISAVEAPGMLPAAELVIDGSGLVACPGFIDVHSHADNAPFLEVDDTSKILQGVTSEVVGNCGFSLAPTTAATKALFETYSRRLFPPLPWAWSSFAELLRATDERGYVTNYVPLLGHHAVRIAALGMSDRAPDAGELESMRTLVREAVDAGVVGLSTGLIYPPGLFAATDEIVALVDALPADSLYATHMRGEGPQVMRSIAEALAIGERTGRQVQISHLKVAGRAAWGSMPRALELIDAAREGGLDVRQDVYPYTAGSTMLTATLPPWFQDGGDSSVLRRLETAKDLARLREDLSAPSDDWENFVVGAGWGGIVVASSASHMYDGLSIAEIAAQRGDEPFSTMIHVLRSENLQVSMIVHHMSEDDLIVALRHPLTMIGSDGLPPGVGGKPHPRTYGTFPRILARFSRELGILKLDEAVRRMTSLPAATFGLADRGVIAPGMAADIVLFDPGRVRDAATFEDSTATPEGIVSVMLNGRIVVSDGAYVGPRSGRRLSRVH